MKSSLFSAAFIALASSTGFCQTNGVDYQYSNNTFSVAQQDKVFTKNGTGKIFYNRIHAFDSFSNASMKNFISREEFMTYLNDFDKLYATAEVNGYGAYVPALRTLSKNIRGMHRLSSGDAHRQALYEILSPVIKVIDESWGEDIVNPVIQEAYLNLYEYARKKANSGEREYATIMNYVNMDPVKVNESLGHCQYTVTIDKPVLQKDDIEVYFCDMALFKKISQKYPGPLLEGPIPGWQGMKDESGVVRSMLQAYQGKRDIPAYYMYMYRLKEFGNPATVQQNLLKGMNWFVWVFRNGTLYYSYMALPCADISKITVYEQRVPKAVDDMNGGTGVEVQ